jgi:hypothetical protein
MTWFGEDGKSLRFLLQLDSTVLLGFDGWHCQ